VSILFPGKYSGCFRPCLFTKGVNLKSTSSIQIEEISLMVRVFSDISYYLQVGTHFSGRHYKKINMDRGRLSPILEFAQKTLLSLLSNNTHGFSNRVVTLCYVYTIRPRD
jgi:hypothetical protein